VIPIVIPPLRNRQEDIPFLAAHFLRKYAAQNASKVTGFTARGMKKLMSQRWEGNVRELENVIERAVVLANSTAIDEADIPSPETVKPDEFFGSATDDFPTFTQLEKRYMALVLEKTAGRKDKAAQILGINRRTLYRKEREFGFVDADSSEDGGEGTDGEGIRTE
jgi:two-component system response regulator HydG